MPRWWGATVLAVVTASCGVVRSTPRVDAPLPVSDEQDEATIRPTDLTHPRTLVWVRRFCAPAHGGPQTALGMKRGRAVLPTLESILDEQGLPRMLVAVPAVESRFHANARGRHGEVGMWQLRVATARRFGSYVGPGRDDRRHLERGTRTAARYLAYLHARYGDWPLALAAYNAGEGRVDRALRRTGQSDFWALAADGALPRHTREYVPRVLAAARVLAAPDREACGPTRAVRADPTYRSDRDRHERGPHAPHDRVAAGG